MNVPGRTPDVIISVRGLARDFGGRTVVGPLDFEVASGQRLALLGENGSGKSTILRCLAGTLRQTRGHISIAGHPAGSLEARQVIGVSLSQERSFDLRLSGRANLVFFARLRLRDRRAAARVVSELEEELELREIAGEKVSNCSTGMTQQLSLARALLADPKLLLLDEPTRSLDEAARARLWRAVKRRRYLALLVATHRKDDVIECDRTVDLGLI